MSANFICYECGGYDVFESMYVRINRLACIVDEEEDLMEMSKPSAWCDTCEDTVILIEADKPLYKEI